MEYTTRLADFICKTQWEQVAEPAGSRCKELLLDGLGCGIGAGKTPLLSTIFSYLEAGRREGDFLLLGSRKTSSPHGAAFANAAAINALDYDDTAHVGHPGSTTIGAALALAGMKDVSGREFLTALIVGYEAAVRVARAIVPSYPRYQQIHGIGGSQVFGAVAACGRIAGLSRDETLNALGIAGAMAPVSHAGKFGWEDKSIAYVKDNVAAPAENGLKAALLAANGFEGSESILDGDRGFWIMAGSDQFDPSYLKDYTSFQLMEIAEKPFPCCRWIHTALEAVSLMQVEDPHRIEEIRVATTAALADSFAIYTPRTFLDIQFSVPFNLALYLCHIPREQWYEARHWQNPKVAKLAHKVKVVKDPNAQERFFALGRSASCIPTTVTMTSGGKKQSQYIETALGSPDKMLSREQREKKFCELTHRVLPYEKQKKILAFVENLDREKSIRPLLELLKISGPER